MQNAPIRPRFASTFRNTSLTLFLATGLVLLVTACGGSTRPADVASPTAPEEPSARYASRGSDTVSPGTTGYADGAPAAEADIEGAAAPSSAASSGYRYDEELQPVPKQRRPGLATQWGESRESYIREVPFLRSSPSSPAAMLRVQYDDEAGIYAATGRQHDSGFYAAFPLHGGDFVVRLEDSSGDPLPALQSGGRNYVVGDAGDRYQIRIDNNTPGRFEVVTSVDGLDVLDGSEAGYENRGYLVNPWSSITVEGFRDSFESVRAFRFGDVETSYAALRGKGRNIGVIGVAVFEERGYRWSARPNETWRRDSAEPFPGRFAPAP